MLMFVNRTLFQPFLVSPGNSPYTSSNHAMLFQLFQPLLRPVEKVDQPNQLNTVFPKDRTQKHPNHPEMEHKLSPALAPA